MSVKSGVEWTRTIHPDGSFTPGSAWSPTTGCTKKSEGCRNCWAKSEVDTRWSKNPQSVFYGREFSDIRCHPEQLQQVIRWRKGRRVFVCPRGDLFHDEIPFEFIAAVFGAMAVASQHTFMITTKSPERMVAFFDWLEHESNRTPNSSGPVSLCILNLLKIGVDLPKSVGEIDPGAIAWPLPNLQLGVSIEDQPTADARVPLLLRVPAAVRWISAEPLLGPVDLTRVGTGPIKINALTGGWGVPRADAPYRQEPRIHAVVSGGESGANARPMHPDHPRSLRDQCEATNTAYFFKQWGEWAPAPEIIDAGGSMFHRFDDGTWMQRFGKKVTGHLLDGRVHHQLPGSIQ